MEKANLAFAPNYANVIELDITPNGPDRTWVYALYGITSCSPSADETVSDDTYYNDLGDTRSTVESVKTTIEMSGHRYYGNECQDWIQSLALKVGQDRETNYRWTMPDGTVLIGQCTITGLTPGSSMGEANAKSEFAYTISINTVDEKIDAASSLAPVEVKPPTAAVTVAKGKTVETNVSILPAEANQKCHYGVEDPSICSIDADGVITGIAEGTTKITAKAAAKPTINAQFEVKVTATGGAGA